MWLPAGLRPMYVYVLGVRSPERARCGVWCARLCVAQMQARRRARGERERVPPWIVRGSTACLASACLHASLLSLSRTGAGSGPHLGPGPGPGPLRAGQRPVSCSRVISEAQAGQAAPAQRRVGRRRSACENCIGIGSTPPYQRSARGRAPRRRRSARRTSTRPRIPWRQPLHTAATRAHRAALGHARPRRPAPPQPASPRLATHTMRATPHCARQPCLRLALRPNTLT